jgi:hypothetical protein
MGRWIETKRHINKPVESYTCDGLGQGQGWVLLSYVSTRDWHIADLCVPAGSTTVALYETGAQFVVWRMTGPDLTVWGHLFHMCTDIEIHSPGVSYLDLLLDVWVSPDGTVRLLDEDELVASVANGLVSHAKEVEIRAAAKDVSVNWRTSVSQIVDFLAQLPGQEHL